MKLDLLAICYNNVGPSEADLQDKAKINQNYISFMITGQQQVFLMNFCLVMQLCFKNSCYIVVSFS
jgi:hypothetical protein